MIQEFDSILNIVENRTGLTFYYNYLLSKQPREFENYPKFLQKPEVRRAIHVGDLQYDDISMTVHEHLNDDMLKTIRPWLETLLEADYKVISNYIFCTFAKANNSASSKGHDLQWPTRCHYCFSANGELSEGLGMVRKIHLLHGTQEDLARRGRRGRVREEGQEPQPGHGAQRRTHSPLRSAQMGL